MRRLIRLTPAALLPLLVAATCVTNVAQKGPGGPWLGQVANTGDQTVWDATVSARIFYNDGTELGLLGVRACPEVILPGQRGAFELSAVTEAVPPADEDSPLRAEFAPVQDAEDGFGPRSGDGLLADVESMLDQHRVVNVRITNNSARMYTDLTLCGVSLTPAGAISSVAFVDANDGTRLAPEDSMTLSLFFAEGARATVRLYPSGTFAGDAPACCPREGDSTWHSVDTGPFSVLLPPSWTYEPRQGIDSLVGAFVGDGAELFFDYGWYSGDPEDPSDPTRRVHLETIAGRTAKIVVGSDYAALHLQVSPDPPDDPFAGITPVDLITIYGDSLNAAQIDIALQIFRSIRFDAP